MNRLAPPIITTDMIISKEELLDQVKNRIGLKDVKVNSELSEESLCFTATICFDGETVGSVKTSAPAAKQDFKGSTTGSLLSGILKGSESLPILFRKSGPAMEKSSTRRK